MRAQRSRTIALIALTLAIGDLGAQVAPTPASIPPGVIIGVVLDASGQPVVGATLQAVVRRKRWLGPYYDTPVGSPDASDDRGQFRLHSLPPGSYVVSASLQPPRPGADRVAGPVPAESTEDVRTYAPDAPSLAEAKPIDVRSGQEQSISIRVARLRLVSVSGVVTTAAGRPAANFNVWLRGGPATIGYTGARGGFMTTSVAGSRTANDGSFRLTRVPAGAYVLAATNGDTGRGTSEPFEIAETPIEVRDASLTGVRVATSPGASVSGRLEWQGRGPAPWPRDRPLGRLRAGGVGRERDFATVDTDIQPDGTFRFTNLYGLRRIGAVSLSGDWVIKTVEAPSDVTAGPNISVTPGRDITGVRVVIVNLPGNVNVRVFDEADKPFDTGWVLLMPRDPREVDPLGWGFQVVPSGGAVDGVWFYQTHVLPGPYLIVAVDVEPYRLHADADLLERARAAATAVDVQPITNLELRVVRLKPFVQGP